MKKPTINRRGFTLIEIIVVIFVTSIMLLGFLSLYEWHGKVYNYQQAVIRVSGSSRSSMQAFSLYTSQAYRVLSDSGSYSTDINTLILQVPSINDSGDVISAKWDTVIFYKSGTNLFLLIQPDASSSRPAVNKILSDTLQSLSFNYNNANFDLITKVTVDMTNSIQ